MMAAWRRCRLEAKRHESLLAIRLERSLFEEMLLRAQFNGNDVPVSIVDVRKQLADLEAKVAQGTSKDELEDLSDEAEAVGHSRAYVCPRTEMVDEGSLRIDVMAEWGVPRTTIQQLRQSLGEKIKSEDITTARGALRAIFEEGDSWSSYFETYHKYMWRYTWVIFTAISLLTPVAILLVHYPKLILAGLFLAGIVGSCASVISKVPVPELRLSSEFESYGARIFSRLGTGTVLSIVASAIIGWGIPVPIQGETFSSILRNCSASPRTTCTEFDMLFVLGVLMGFGFTERLVTHFEGPWFGQFRRPARRARTGQGTTLHD